MKNIESTIPRTAQEIAAANAFLKIPVSPNTLEDCRKVHVSAGELCAVLGCNPSELLRLAAGVPPSMTIDQIPYFDYIGVRTISDIRRRRETPVQEMPSDALLRYHQVQAQEAERAAKANGRG